MKADISENDNKNDHKKEEKIPNEMIHSFRDEELTAHAVQNTPLAQSVPYSKPSGPWTSSISTGLSEWFSRDNQYPSSSFLPYCRGQLGCSSRIANASRENLRYSDPTIHKINSNSGVVYGEEESPAIGTGNGTETGPGSIRSILWGVVARHIEELSDTDVQLAGLI